MIQVTFISNNGKVVAAPERSNLLRVSLRDQGAGYPSRVAADYAAPANAGSKPASRTRMSSRTANAST